MTEPIDRTHAESIVVIDQIRQRVTLLKSQAAMWRPGPCPTEWGNYQPINRNTINRRTH
jgi:hypothetical protein